MKEELQIDLLEVLVKHNVVPLTVLRNEKIKMEYNNLRTGGVKSKEARRLLAEKYFTSDKNIESILYGKKKDQAGVEL